MKKENLYVILFIFGCISYFLYKPIQPKEKIDGDTTTTYRPTSSISGKIVNNKTDLPVPQATIVLSGSNLQVLSDRNGNYTIGGKKGDQLIIRRQGYRSLLVDITDTLQNIKILPLDSDFEKEARDSFISQEIR